MRSILIFISIIFFSELNASDPKLIFKENKGQWPEKVLFGTEFLNTKFYVNKTGFNYCVYNLEEYSRPYKRSEENSIVHGHNYEVNFEGANLNSFQMKDKLNEYYNYFIGKDRSKWSSNVKASKFLHFDNIYDGIDLNVYSNSVNLKYDFIVSSLASPDQIKLNYEFVAGIEIRKNKLIIKTSVGEIIEETPIAYQIINGKKKIIECSYKLVGNSVGFTFPDSYDKNYELIIDPVVIVCSYSGTSAFGFANTCNYDSKGNIYTAGYAGIGYPTTIGAFQVNASSEREIFISAFNSNGTAKLFSTYIGGDDFEMAVDLAVSNTDIVILGQSSSYDYPHTYTSFDTILGGDRDLVLTKINIAGTNLLASTYVGGSLYEDIDQFSMEEQISSEMTVDAQKNIYVTSNSTSSDFPTTPGVFSSVRIGSSDGVVFKMDSSLNIVWSTYLGGSGKEDGLNIRTDGSGGVYISGTTGSNDFPTTPGAYNQFSNSSTLADLFVAHLNNTGSTLIASTYLGTTTSDDGAIMALDASNNVYVSGRLPTTTPGFLIATPGTYSTASANSFYKLNSSLTTLSFKTLFGGGYPRPNFMVTAIKVDSCQNIYLAGWAWGGQVITPNAFMPFQGGGSDMYMMVFTPNCSSLKFASYFGGSGSAPTGWSGVGEYSWGKSHFDDKGVLYLGFGSTENLPTTPGAYCTSYNDTVNAGKIYTDAFLKVDFQTYVNANSSYGANVTICPAPITASFVSTTNTGTTFWDFGDGNTSTLNTVTHTYTNSGTYNTLLIVTDTTTCNRIDSIKSVFNIINPTIFDLGDDKYLCPNSSLILNSNISAASYSWSSGQTSPNIYVNQTGAYTLEITNNGGCKTSDEIIVLQGENNLQNFPNVITPNDDNANDFIDFKKFHFEEMEFILFDRWGKEHYRITNPDESLKPKDLINGTYYYIVTYKSNCTGKHSTSKGFISVLK